MPSMMFLLTMPTLRLLKLLRRFQNIYLLFEAFAVAFEALPVLLFTLSTIVLSFAAVIYCVEPRDNIASMPDALWFCIVTTATVGFGDIAPESPAGRLVVTVLIVCS